MPCYDPRDREDDEHMAKGAALLCAYMKDLSPGGRKLMPEKIQRWYKKHQERDRY